MNYKTKTIVASLFIGALFLLAVASFAQTPEKLTGTWTNAQNTRKVEFYAEGGKYYGKLISTTDDAKAKPGDILFKDLVWKGSSFKGNIATPAHGDVSCTLVFEGDDKIQITGSKYFKSKSVYWTRVK